MDNKEFALQVNSLHKGNVFSFGASGKVFYNRAVYLDENTRPDERYLVRNDKVVIPKACPDNSDEAIKLAKELMYHEHMVINNDYTELYHIIKSFVQHGDTSKLRRL